MTKKKTSIAAQLKAIEEGIAQAFRVDHWRLGPSVKTSHVSVAGMASATRRARKTSKSLITPLLRTTLAIVARDELGIDVVEQVAQRRQQPIVDMLAKADKSFSKYRLAKTFLH